MFSILITYPHIIAFVVWASVAIIAFFRYFDISVFKRVSWKRLIVFAIVFHLGYASLLTWGQYHTWSAVGNNFGESLLAAELPNETPLPIFFEWMRPYLERPLGYFAFYSFMRFFLGPLTLFGLAGVFAIFFKFRARYHPINFREGDIAAITIAILVSGWPGAIVLLPVGFLIAILISLWTRFTSGIERTLLPPAFLVAAPVVLIWGISILKFTHLYALLKL